MGGWWVGGGVGLVGAWRRHVWAGERQLAAAMPAEPACHDAECSLSVTLCALPMQVGAVQQKQWSVSLAVPALSLSLLYPEEAGCGSPHFAPRLVAEVAELVVHAEASVCRQCSMGVAAAAALGMCCCCCCWRIVSCSQRQEIRAKPPTLCSPGVPHPSAVWQPQQ